MTSKFVYFQRYVLSRCSSINLTILISFYANLTMITPLHVAGQRMHACDLAKLKLFFCVWQRCTNELFTEFNYGHLIIHHRSSSSIYALCFSDVNLLGP